MARESVFDQLSKQQRDRCWKIQETFEKERSGFCYCNLIKDDSYIGREYCVITYPMNAAVPAKWFPQAKTAEEAIQLAEKELSIN